MACGSPGLFGNSLLAHRRLMGHREDRRHRLFGCARAHAHERMNGHLLTCPERRVGHEALACPGRVALAFCRGGCRCATPPRSRSRPVVPASPRKLIWVCGEASSVPGRGETATELAWASARSAVGVRPFVAALEDPLLPQAHRPAQIARPPAACKHGSSSNHRRAQWTSCAAPPPRIVRKDAQAPLRLGSSARRMREHVPSSNRLRGEWSGSSDHPAVARPAPAT